MATFEHAGLALQLVNNIHGLVRDIGTMRTPASIAGADDLTATVPVFERTF